MHKAYFRNFMATAELVIVSLFITGCAFAFLGRSVFIRETRQNLLLNASELTGTVARYVENGKTETEDFRTILNSAGSNVGKSIFLTDEHGLVLLSSESGSVSHLVGTALNDTVMNRLNRAEPVQLLGDLDGFFDSEHYTVASPIRSIDGQFLGYLFLAETTTAALDIWENILPLFIVISLGVLIIALVLSFTFSRLLAKPIRSMASAAREYSHGNYSVRVEGTGHEDEVNELVQAFNSMADSLEKSEARRRDFVANVSHELKTPMTTISGFANGILDGTIPPENEKKYLEIIASETNRLSRLVKSMLELSRLQAGDRTELLKKNFEIDEVLRLTLINFVDKIESKQLDVDFDVPENPMTVLGEADAITQVVYNLLDNAIKFSPPGETLGISLWKDDNKAYVSIRNRGTTIPESELPFLFDRFHKSDYSRSKDKDGVGLGLYIVKTIINNFGEDITVTSHNGLT